MTLETLTQQANQVLERCDSTNDVARKLGEAGYPDGTWVSTRFQDKGRGRLGRKWESLEGNLFLSVVVRFEERQSWTWIPMAAAIAIAKAVRKTFPHYELPVTVKWPNDLWIHGKKLGGILCEAVGNKEGSFIIVGMGVNCTYAPDGLDQETTSLSDVAGVKIEADEIRGAVLAELKNALGLLKFQGSVAISSEYEKIAALPNGSLISWNDSAGKTNSGKIRGLGNLGELLVTLDSGEQVSLYAEDISGKVRPKSNS